MSGKERRSDGLLGERGNERRRAPQAPPVLHATALLLDSTAQVKAELKQRMHDPLPETARWLQSVVRGYFQYQAVPSNEKRLSAFRTHVLRIWLRQIRRRSQRSRWTWDRFLARLGGLLPDVCILHPFPQARFDAKHPR